MTEQQEKNKKENTLDPKWKVRIEKVATLYFGFCRRSAAAITRAKNRKNKPE